MVFTEFLPFNFVFYCKTYHNTIQPFRVRLNLPYSLNRKSCNITNNNFFVKYILLLYSTRVFLTFVIVYIDNNNNE